MEIKKELEMGKNNRHSRCKRHCTLYYQQGIKKSNEQNISLEEGNSRSDFKRQPHSVLVTSSGARLEYHKFRVKHCANLKNSKNFPKSIR